MAKTESVSFRLGKAELILIDHAAAKAGISRSEFIKATLVSRFKEDKLAGKQQKKEGEQINRLIDSFIELNITVDGGFKEMVGLLNSQKEVLSSLTEQLEVEKTGIRKAEENLLRNFMKLAQAFIAMNPKAEKELRKIFTNPRLWGEANG